MATQIHGNWGLISFLIIWSGIIAFGKQNPSVADVTS